jgi:predicted HicB family RNase H-like nuclease
MTNDVYDAEEIDMLRREFASLKDGADFCVFDSACLRKIGEISLLVPPDLHQKLSTQAATHDKSINAWVPGVLKDQSATVVHA